MPGSEAELALVLRAKDLASREVGKLRGSLSGLGSAAGTIAKGALIGLTGAVIGIGAALFEATKRAAEEQVGIARMGAALKANIKNFDGNTTAIEGLISKREELGFSDDALRNSLTTLVTKYKDVKQAEDIQAVAMDVARLKGISLEEATQLVSKGMDGNAKVLKQLGIELPATATQTDRLAAIQKKAAGQAQAYGNTAAGAQEAFQIAMDDLVEDVGSGFLPIMRDFFTMLRTKVIPAVRGIIQTVQKWFAENKPLIDQIMKFAGGVLGFLIDQAAILIGWFVRIFNTITSNKTVMDILRTSFDLIAKAVGGVISALRTLVHWAEQAIDALSHIALPDLSGLTNWIPHFATGGTVPGPIGHPIMVVAHGGEKVNRSGSDNTRSTSGITLVGVSEQDIMDMVDRGFYFKLQRSAPTLTRT